MTFIWTRWSLLCREVLICLFKGQGVNGSNFGLTGYFWPAQLWALAAGRTALNWFFLRASWWVFPTVREQQQCCVCYSQCLQVPGKKLSDLQERSQLSYLISSLLGQSVLQTYCRSSRQAVFSFFFFFFPDLLSFTYTYMSSVFRLK